MENKTFEQMMEELSLIVDELEKGNLSLDEAVRKYQQGIQLSADLQKQLEQAKEVIVKKMN
jgi:exodeoxyribonuclease VII small subunit